MVGKLNIEGTAIDNFLQLSRQIGAFLLLILRDQVWQGIGGIAALVGLFLTLRGISSEKSTQAELDRLRSMLEKEVMYHQTAPPQKQRQKAPLSKMLHHMLVRRTLFSQASFS